MSQKLEYKLPLVMTFWGKLLPGFRIYINIDIGAIGFYSLEATWIKKKLVVKLPPVNHIVI